MAADNGKSPGLHAVPDSTCAAEIETEWEDKIPTKPDPHRDIPNAALLRVMLRLEAAVRSLARMVAGLAAVTFIALSLVVWFLWSKT